MSRAATAADVDLICTALPDTELGTSWGAVPTWKVPRGPRGKGFVLRREPRADAVDPSTGDPWDDLLVIRVPDLGVRDALVAGDNPFFTIHHFRNHPSVLVSESRLGEIDVDELREVITEAWATMAPARLSTQYFEGA